ncbi:nucleoporin protein Ndc1-Nup [Phaeosphaeriaceae sp. PMI808]|nr:nucleoporin protein Ndc1-Nup [Phaeosphaeriaceae sp. PMI808]
MALTPVGVQVRPYRDYLTPSLHRRFNKASRYTLLLCYLMACVMGDWSDALWLWFPLGPTGIRTLLFFLPALIIYVLRVAQWHVGVRQTTTPIETFQKYFLRKSTFLTLAFYTFSAWLYGEVCIWSHPATDKLGFTDIGRGHERVKLNERLLFYRFLFFGLAVSQTAVHLWDDYDSIYVPAMKPKKSGDDTEATVPGSVRPMQVLTTKFPAILATAGSISAFTFVIGSLVYFIGPRHLVWDYYYAFSRSFISLSKTSKPTGVAPFLPLAWAFMKEGTLLVCLWQFVNRAFDLYIAQEPYKNNQPITSDSKDPNGTLLNGLRSKKQAPQAIAFWELALVTDSFPERRKLIYSETERKKGETFQQIADICLAEIRFLIERLNIGLDPSYSPKTTISPEQPTAPVQLVSQISQPLKEDKKITAAPPKPVNGWEQAEAATAWIAKSHSSPGNAQQAYGREALHKGLTKANQGKAHATSILSTYSTTLISSPLGSPFRHSLARTTSLVLLGAPYSRLSQICNATTALTNLATFSLKQDSLGRFHTCVPSIIRVFTQAIAKIDAYMAAVDIHWSDFETWKRPEGERRKAERVEEVRECLREGLERVLGGFNEFLGAWLARGEILEAKKCVGARGGEMEMVGKGKGR